jgi:CelD/BcsL family acetyltransferase involved in cellulose biosynthesis
MPKHVELGEISGLPGGLTVRQLHASDRDAWTRLYNSVATLGTESPQWLSCVAAGLPVTATFTPVGVFTDSDLIAVAPFVVETGRLTRITLMGSFVGTAIHDYPVVTTSTADERKVMRALIGALIAWSRQWTIASFTTTADAYVLPQWTADHPGYRARPTITRMSPVLDVTTWETSISRNLRESLRRGRNRLKRDYEGWTVTRHDNGDGWDAAVQRLVALQSARSGLERGPKHEFTLGSAEGQALTKALASLDKHDLRIYELEGAGQAKAALLAAVSPVGVQIVFSGMNAEAWDYSPMPQLIKRLCEDAVAENLQTLTFPSGVDESKLRWGTRIELRPEFLLVKPALSSRLLHIAHAAASEAGAQGRARRYESRGGQK